MPGMDLGIDLGTSRVTIYASGRGIVLREPSVIAVDSDSGKMIACGRKAYAMLGRTPGSIEAVRPLSKGVISDYDYAEQMLRHFVRRVCAYKILKPRAAVSVPASVTEVEQRSVIEAVRAAGARRVVLIEESMAAAIGAGLTVSEPRGSMVADIGGGTTDVAVMSLKGMAASLSVRVGGNDMDEAIVRYLHNKYNHVIGLLTAEQVKIRIGRAVDQPDDPVMPVKGRNAATGLPCVREVRASEIQEALKEPVEEIIAAVQRVMENTPPELTGDILEDGVVLTGGASRLSGLDELLTRRTGVLCRLAENPSDCVALGTGKALKFVGVLSSGVYDISRFTTSQVDSIPRSQ